jgi:hypothetical protein
MPEFLVVCGRERFKGVNDSKGNVQRGPADYSRPDRDRIYPGAGIGLSSARQDFGKGVKIAPLLALPRDNAAFSALPLQPPPTAGASPGLAISLRPFLP